MKIRAFLVIVWLSEMNCQPNGLNVKFSWSIPEFQFPNSSIKNLALYTDSYIPENNVIYGIGVWKDKIFVSVYRLKAGVVSAFNYFSANCETKSPVLIPYPSFDSNYVSNDPVQPTGTLPSKKSIINSAYFRIDYKCDRLWIIDNGVIDIFGAARILTAPAIVIFDLNTDKLIRRYTIPSEFVSSNTLFANLEIDFGGKNCNDAYAYIVDMFRSIVVYSFNKDRSWRLTHNYFGSDPDASNFFYEGINFQLGYGILGITVGEKHRDGSKRVYIKPFASTATYYISNKILQDESYIAFNNYFYDVRRLGDRGNNSQIYVYAYDKKTKILFDTQFLKKRIGCWNTANRYKNSKFDVVHEGAGLFYPSDVNIDDNRYLWVVSNNYIIFAYGCFDASQQNIQIYKGKVDDLISGTVCEK